LPFVTNKGRRHHSPRQEEPIPAAATKTSSDLAPVYSSLNLHWMIENVPGAKKRVEAGELAFGTIDSCLIYKRTGGKVHAVAASNATVTGSYDMLHDEWYGE